MIGSQVERQGIIRHGAKILFAVAEATVPSISVIVRKAYGAGYMAMSGASFLPDACIALATAKLAVMGPDAAINAIHLNTIQSLDGLEREAFVRDRRAEYNERIDIYRIASDFLIDAVVPGRELREELIRRFERMRQSPAAGTAVERGHPRMTPATGEREVVFAVDGAVATLTLTGPPP